jgi:hypothetical protein
MLRVLTFCVFCLVVGALGFSLWLGLVPVLTLASSRRLFVNTRDERKN